eukprot:244491_1
MPIIMDISIIHTLKTNSKSILITHLIGNMAWICTNVSHYRDQIPRQIYRNVINAIGYCIYGRDAVDFQNQNIVVIVSPEEYDSHQKEAKDKHLKGRAPR